MSVEITGKIRFTDGSESEFTIDEFNGYNQWGANVERLGRSQPVLEAITDALFDKELFKTDEEGDGE